MKLVRYGPAGKEKPGLIDADGKLRDLSRKVKDIDGATLAPAELAKLQEARPEASCRWSRASRASAPCVATPSKFVAIGLNYVDHAKETGSPIPENPDRVLQGADLHRRAQRQRDAARRTRRSSTGKSSSASSSAARRATSTKKDALQVRRRLLRHQRRVGARVPAEEGRVAVGQGQGLRHLRPARARGSSRPTRSRIRRTSTCGSTSTASAGRPATRSTMIFGVAELVSDVSQYMTLLPGDVITTGTPPGVGLGMKPPEFLKAGDVVTLGIEGLGEQKQKVVPFKGKR